MGRVVLLGLIVIIGASLGLVMLGLALSGGNFEGNELAESEPPASGMALLQAYRCHRAETKRIFVRGVEDGFSPQGEEPIFIHPRLRSPRMESLLRGASYDQSQPDRFFLDTIELPPRIVRGLLVIALRPIVDNANDSFMIGDMATVGRPRAEQRLFQTQMDRLATVAGWRNSGALHYAELEAIQFNTHTSSIVERPERIPVPSAANLLEFVRSGEELRPVDVRVAEDTSVDFIGIVVCEEPPAGTGLTFGVADRRTLPQGLVHISCLSGPADQRVCDPYVGDLSCQTPLPVACFRDLDLPVPQSLIAAGLANRWSGGRLAFAPPARASRFQTAAEVDAYCAAAFGVGWRIATYHDSGGTADLTAYGSGEGVASRVWIDIRGQPYATCWAH